jgi:hypothetical protein
MENFLHKKIAGLPAGVWLLIIAGGIAAGVIIRKRAEASAPTDSQDQQASDGQDTGTDVTPYSDLASEDYGGYPMTGGGPPNVYGGAIQLDPGTLKIRIIQPKPPHHGTHHNCPVGHHWSAQKKRCVRN